MDTPVNPKFIQAQSFFLQASGASAGDTVLNVQSFTYPDGTNIVTGDLGDWCFGTIEPNNGTQEEAIQFTGVTQNANGTAQLTGVSSVGFKSPYTVTSGLAKSHAGGVTFIISNDAGMYGNLVTYFTATVGSGIAPKATGSVAGIVQIPTAAQINATNATGSTGAYLAITPDQLAASNYGYVNNIVSKTGVPYAVGSGTALALTATVSSGYATLASGVALNLLVPISNASGVTLNLNGLGAQPITKISNTVGSGDTILNTLASGDLQTGQVISLVFDGTRFQLTSPTSQYISYVASGTTTHDMSSTTTTVIPHGLGITPKIVRINGTYGGNSTTGSTVSAVYSGASLSAVSEFHSTATGSLVCLGQQVAAFFANASQYTTFAIVVDGTNIYMSWTKSGTPTGTANFTWEAMA